MSDLSELSYVYNCNIYVVSLVWVYIHILQGSVATRLMCGASGIFDDHCRPLLHI